MIKAKYESTCQVIGDTHTKESFFADQNDMDDYFSHLNKTGHTVNLIKCKRVFSFSKAWNNFLDKLKVKAKEAPKQEPEVLVVDDFEPMLNFDVKKELEGLSVRQPVIIKDEA